MERAFLYPEQILISHKTVILLELSKTDIFHSSWELVKIWSEQTWMETVRIAEENPHFGLNESSLFGAYFC